MTDTFTDEDGKRYTIVSYGDELPGGFREPTPAEYREMRWDVPMMIGFTVAVIAVLVWLAVRVILG